MSQQPFGFGPPDPDDESNPGQPSPADPLSALFGGAGAGDIGQALQRFGQLLSSADGPVSWQLANDTARQALADAGDASLTSGEQQAVVEALKLADLWLDPATSLGTGASHPAAWCRAEWIENTLPRWRTLIQTLAERVAAAQSESLPSQLPEQMQQMAGPLMGMMQQMSGVMFGMQVGQGLGALATEVVGSTDVGYPLADEGTAALVPANIAALSEGLELPAEEVRLYLALRECAHVRLFHHAPWLRSRITADINDYASGISVDVSGMESLMQGVDPTNPAALQELVQSGVFEPPTTEQQQAALGRLETVLALVEGWVDEVVHQAAVDRLPSEAAMRETLRRRRAAGGPAEATFETLVGLQLRPRRLREAATFWAALGQARGQDGRDALWAHPDLLPTTEDLDDPQAYLAGAADAGTPLDLSTLDDTPAPKESNPEESDSE